jgi:hypothetical protein
VHGDDCGEQNGAFNKSETYVHLEYQPHADEIIIHNTIWWEHKKQWNPQNAQKVTERYTEGRTGGVMNLHFCSTFQFSTLGGQSIPFKRIFRFCGHGISPESLKAVDKSWKKSLKTILIMKI